MQGTYLRVLHRLSTLDTLSAFHEHSHDQIPDYTKLIPRPLFIPVIAALVNCGYYPTSRSFEKDLLVMLANCCVFCGVKSEFTDQALTLLKNLPSVMGEAGLESQFFPQYLLRPSHYLEDVSRMLQIVDSSEVLRFDAVLVQVANNTTFLPSPVLLQQQLQGGIGVIESLRRLVLQGYFYSLDSFQCFLFFLFVKLAVLVDPVYLLHAYQFLHVTPFGRDDCKPSIKLFVDALAKMDVQGFFSSPRLEDGTTVGRAGVSKKMDFLTMRWKCRLGMYNTIGDPRLAVQGDLEVMAEAASLAHKPDHPMNRSIYDIRRRMGEAWLACGYV